MGFSPFFMLRRVCPKVWSVVWKCEFFVLCWVGHSSSRLAEPRNDRPNRHLSRTSRWRWCGKLCVRGLLLLLAHGVESVRWPPSRVKVIKQTLSPSSPSEGLKGVRFCFFLDSRTSSASWMFSHTQQHKRKQTFWGRKILKGWRGCCFFSSFCGMEILLRFFCIYLGKEVCNCLGATVYEVWKMWDNKYRVKWYDMLDERRTQQ